MVDGPQSPAAHFDGWYADVVGSPTKDEIVQRHLGLPPDRSGCGTVRRFGALRRVLATATAPG